MSLLVTLILSACGTVPLTLAPTPSQPAATRTAASSATLTPTRAAPIQIDPASLRGLHLQLWDAFSGPAAVAFADQVALFNTVNEWGIVLYPTSYGDYTSLDEAVNTGLASGPKPDLVVALPEQALAWLASGAVMDLNPYVNDPSWGLRSSEIADIPPLFWAQDLSDGRRSGVPAQRSARFLFYNKTWAHELGFDHAPATADEFRQQACAANASFRKDADPHNDGYGGWIVDTAWGTTLAWMTAFGGGVVKGGAYHFNSDENLTALQFLKKLYDDHCAWLPYEPPPTEPTPYELTPYDPFARRLALFVSADLAEVPLETGVMARLKNGDEWTVIPFPGPQKQALVSYGPEYTLLHSSPERQLAAWLFVRWELSPENQAKWAAASGSFPLRTSALDSLAEARASQPQWDAALGYLSFAQGTPPLASWRTVRYVLEDGALSIFRTNLPAAQISAVLAEMDATAGEVGNK